MKILFKWKYNSEKTCWEVSGGNGKKVDVYPKNCQDILLELFIDLNWELNDDLFENDQLSN